MHNLQISIKTSFLQSSMIKNKPGTWGQPSSGLQEHYARRIYTP